MVMLRLISTEDLYTIARIGYHIVSNKHIKEKEYKYYSLRINERSEIIISFGKMDTAFLGLTLLIPIIIIKGKNSIKYSTN